MKKKTMKKNKKCEMKNAKAYGISAYAIRLHKPLLNDHLMH
jgi:hypothetical protein